MLGSPVTLLGKFAEGTNGYIVIADTDNLYLENVNSVQFIDESDTTTLLDSSGTDLVTLNSYLESDSPPDAAWAKTSSLLYMFFKTSVYAYDSNTVFIVFGSRTGIPISAMNDTIDIPEKHLELFVKYAIKEAAQLLGRQVPPSILNDITELETNL